MQLTQYTNSRTHVCVYTHKSTEAETGRACRFILMPLSQDHELILFSGKQALSSQDDETINSVSHRKQKFVSSYSKLCTLTQCVLQ